MKKGTFQLSLIILMALAFTLTACDKAAEPSAEPSVEGTAEVVETSNKLAEISGESAYQINSETSILGYSAKKLASDPHTGKVSITEGNVKLAEGEFVSGEFTIDMATITEDKNNEKYIGHVESADFFDIATFPTAKFVITDIQKSGDKYLVTGDLTIKDQTHEIQFDATAEITETGITAQAAFAIDRTKWGIVYGSGSFIKDLGDKAIEDQIHFTLNLTFDAE